MSPHRTRPVPELRGALHALNAHLGVCPACLRWGFELCDRGLLLSNGVIRARAAREALGLLGGDVSEPVPEVPALA